MSDLIEWKDGYELGIEEVDHEHREMIALINAVHALLGESAPDEEIQAFLAEVHASIAAHFALEERLMRHAGYAEYEQHKHDHERLLDDILDIMDRFEAKAVFDSDEFRTRLDRWFTEHFRTFDARLHAVLG